jgi:hypothetical protein
MIALALGVILGASEPEYLIALIPIEALIAFELIYWIDCSSQRRNEQSRSDARRDSKLPPTSGQDNEFLDVKRSF